MDVLRRIGPVAVALVMLLPVPAFADVIDDILKNGVVRIGVAEFVPWTFKNKSDELAGFDIAVGKKIAEDMGVTADFKLYEFDQIIAALTAGEIDMIASGMAITPSRALQINFSHPYMESGITLASNVSLTEAINSLEDLNDPDIVISAVNDTLALELAGVLFDEANIQSFPDSLAAEQLVLDGKAHALIASVPEARFLALEHPDVIDVPLSEPLLRSKSGLAVAKGEQEWLNFLNSWVVAREADNWLGATYDYWFESLDWIGDTNH